MGAQRRQHHRQQEAMRAATAEANRFQDMMRAQEEANRRMAEALKPNLEELRPPRTVASTLRDSAGVRTARSARKTTTGVSKGLAALRIPLNIGANTGGSLNIG
jgi:hypothetical protein